MNILMNIMDRYVHPTSLSRPTSAGAFALPTAFLSLQRGEAWTPRALRRRARARDHEGRPAPLGQRPSDSSNGWSFNISYYCPVAVPAEAQGLLQPRRWDAVRDKRRRPDRAAINQAC